MSNFPKWHLTHEVFKILFYPYFHNSCKIWQPQGPPLFEKKIKLRITHFLIKGIFLTVLKNVESAPTPQTPPPPPQLHFKRGRRPPNVENCSAGPMNLKERLLISLNPQKFFLARTNAKSHNFFIWVMFNLIDDLLGPWKQYFPFPNTEISLISERRIIRWVVFNQLFDLRFLFVRYYPVVPFSHSNIS